jgi:hypothetical protein
MIHIGYNRDQNAQYIHKYTVLHDITAVVYISPDTPCIPDVDYVPYNKAHFYVYFYRLLQEINTNTLIVIDECLQTQNRYDLIYNCIRHYVNRTSHVLVFNYLPQIDTCEDIMILFDFVTQSRWKQRSFDPVLITDNINVCINRDAPNFTKIDVHTSDVTKQKYDTEREKLFASLGSKDPHTIPRNLYLLTGKDKEKILQDTQTYVARNARLKRNNVYTYDTFEQGNHTIIELPHRFIDFSNYARVVDAKTYNVMVADTKTDAWYFTRYENWSKRINETIASLR